MLLTRPQWKNFIDEAFLFLIFELIFLGTDTANKGINL
jgi:hypothetical protein